MGNLTFEDKLNIYYSKRMENLSILSNKYNIDSAGIKYLIRLIDKHNININYISKDWKIKE